VSFLTEAVSKMEPESMPIEKVSAIKLTNYIAIGLFLLFELIGIILITGSNKSTAYTLLIAAPFYLTPYFLNRVHLYTAGRILLTLFIPLTILTLSIQEKMATDFVPSSLSYMGFKVLLLNGVILPFIIFEPTYKWKIALTTAPTIVFILTFDLIHSLLGVGYQSGNNAYSTFSLLLIITLALLVGVFIYFKYQLKQKDDHLNFEKDKLKLYLDELVKLSNSPNINNGIVGPAKKEIIKAARNCLQVSRVSVWSFDKEEDYIECQYLFENDTFTSPRTILHGIDFPSYFAELKNQQLIIAQDAQTNPSTKEFTESYLKPLSIFSMMDAPFFKYGKLGGVICCEHQHEHKVWTAAESLVLKAFGDFLSYTLMVNERIEKSKTLAEKNEEILSINKNLESLVSKRTKEIELKNQQLTEYAFINSHLLKAPIARISGLYNLFQKLKTSKKSIDAQIYDHMNLSILELKQITTEIDRAIEENGIVDRTQLKRRQRVN